MYYDKGDMKLGIWIPTLRTFWVKICSTTLAMLLRPQSYFVEHFEALGVGSSGRNPGCWSKFTWAIPFSCV